MNKFIATYIKKNHLRVPLVQRPSDTPEEAQLRADALIANNERLTLTQIFGEGFEKSIKITPVECYANGDMKCTVFGTDTKEVVIRWTATYETTVRVHEDTDLDSVEVKDMAADINIDVDGSEYQTDTWEVEKISLKA